VTTASAEFLKVPPQAFTPRGPIALCPEAYGGIFTDASALANTTSDDVIVVSIRGPLMNHEEWWYDSYESIKQRVCAALEARPRAVVLSIDSPGGLVSGCFETASDIRTFADVAGVPLHAYVNGQATSAAYALASICDSITCPEAGTVGSIGVITGLLDVTKNDAAYGYRFAFISSGERKTDGQPHVALTDAAVKATQARVDELAEVFFKHVSAERGLSVESIRALQAGLLTGASAKSIGLVDAVGSLDQLIARLANNESISGPTKAAATTGREEASATEVPSMKTLLTALGLGANASEAEGLAALQKLTGTASRFLELAGKPDAGAAEGVFLAWKIGAEKSAAAEAQLVALQKASVDAEASALIASAVADGKLPPGDEPTVQGLYSAYGLGALKASLSVLKPLVTAQQKLAPVVETNGKRASLTPEEKAHCVKHNLDEALYLAAINEER
jgi:signal peptide peptidase SppA